MKRLERGFHLRWLVSTGAIWAFVVVIFHLHFPPGRILHETFGGCFFDALWMIVFCMLPGLFAAAFWSAMKDEY